ncbi:hypothetical protein Tco_0438971 [Tanacetum coccineum]
MPPRILIPPATHFGGQLISIGNTEPGEACTYPKFFITGGLSESYPGRGEQPTSLLLTTYTHHSPGYIPESRDPEEDTLRQDDVGGSRPEEDPARLSCRTTEVLDASFGESSAAGAARQFGPTTAEADLYGFTDMLEAAPGRQMSREKWHQEEGPQELRDQGQSPRPPTPPPVTTDSPTVTDPTTYPTSSPNAQLQAMIERGCSLLVIVSTCHDPNGDIAIPGNWCKRRNERTIREVQTYPRLQKCHPYSFKGTEGVVSLTQWFERMETVFRISNCTVENQVKFATCTLMGTALTWWELTSKNSDK